MVRNLVKVLYVVIQTLIQAVQLYFAKHLLKYLTLEMVMLQNQVFMQIHQVIQKMHGQQMDHFLLT